MALGSHNNCDANLAPGNGWNRVSVFTKDPIAVELTPLADFAAELAAELAADRLDVADFNNGDDAPDLVVAATENMMLFFTVMAMEHSRLRFQSQVSRASSALVHMRATTMPMELMSSPSNGRVNNVCSSVHRILS